MSSLVDCKLYHTDAELSMRKLQHNQEHGHVEAGGGWLDRYCRVGEGLVWGR